jgi:hypothetical protein
MKDAAALERAATGLFHGLRADGRISARELVKRRLMRKILARRARRTAAPAPLFHRLP